MRASEVTQSLTFLFVYFEGDIFIQAKAALEDVYKIYCYHHDDANQSLKSYEKEEEIKEHFIACVLALKYDVFHSFSHHSELLKVYYI